MKLQQLKDQFKQLSGLVKTDSKTVRAYIKITPELGSLTLDLRRKVDWERLIEAVKETQHGFSLDTEPEVEFTPEPVKRSPRASRRRVSKRASELLSGGQIISLKQPVKSEEEAETPSQWVAYPLAECDLDEEDVEFIKWSCPSFDWTIPYTYKAHRQLFKALKARFRNPDGTLKHPVANEAVMMLQRTIPALFDQSREVFMDYHLYEDALELLLSRKYKSVA